MFNLKSIFVLDFQNLGICVEHFIDFLIVKKINKLIAYFCNSRAS